MKVVIKEVGHPPRIADMDNTLEAMQNTVGGNIEMIPLPYPSLLIIMDEDGKNKGYKPNILLSGDYIAGDTFITASTPDGDLRSLTDEESAYAINYINKRYPFWQDFDLQYPER